MPNYNAHTYFGMKVLEELPVEARQSCVEDLPVFRTALYGPDPLLYCSVKAKRRADYLHKTWRDQVLTELERSVRLGSGSVRSFAAGYLLHMLLDDAVHACVYRKMAEGSNHQRMELALDRMLLDELGVDRQPHLAVQGRKRTTEAAAGFITPATEQQYGIGLLRMAAVTDMIRLREKQFLAGVTRVEAKHAREMREILEETISPSAGMLAGLLE